MAAQERNRGRGTASIVPDTVRSSDEPWLVGAAPLADNLARGRLSDTPRDDGAAKSVGAAQAWRRGSPASGQFPTQAPPRDAHSSELPPATSRSTIRPRGEAGPGPHLTIPAPAPFGDDLWAEAQRDAAASELLEAAELAPWPGPEGLEAVDEALATTPGFSTIPAPPPDDDDDDDD